MFRLGVRKKLHDEGGEALEQLALRSCECPIPERAQGQAGWDFGQPNPRFGTLV